jgi:predicted RNase H-like HicB family nuclease
MISRYIEQALVRARYEQLEAGTYCETPGRFASEGGSHSSAQRRQGRLFQPFAGRRGAAMSNYCATVPGLRGVLATGRSVEDCRRNLANVVEEWILVRVARGLSVPRLRRITIRVRRAS